MLLIYPCAPALACSILNGRAGRHELLFTVTLQWRVILHNHMSSKSKLPYWLGQNMHRYKSIWVNVLNARGTWTAGHDYTRPCSQSTRAAWYDTLLCKKIISHNCFWEEHRWSTLKEGEKKRLEMINQRGREGGKARYTTSW